MLMILNIITWIINLIMVILAVIMYKKYETLQICPEHDQHVLEDDGEY